jgi:predicted component of type VI protein secretion system
MERPMPEPDSSLDLQTPNAAVSEIAKGMSALRDALQAMAELAERGAPVSALAPHLRQAWSGAAAVSMVCAMVGAMDWPARPQGVGVVDLAVM